MHGPLLITGAAGFIGSNLVDSLLADGEQVAGLDNFCDFYDPARKRGNLAAALRHPGFTLVDVDIRNRQAVLQAMERHRPAAVIHLAAMAGVRPSIDNPALYTAVNIDGTVHLLDAAVRGKVGKFLFASSSSVYGNNPKVPFAESDNVDHPISPYAATKKAGELLCHTYAHLYKLPIFCLRFFTVFGPRQRPDLAIAKFLALAAAGKPIPVFGDGSTSRDYTFIADIVAGIRAALARCGKTEQDRYGIYNLGGNEPISLQQMLAAITQVVGRPLDLQRLPMQPGDVERTWADLSRSTADLGYRPQTRFIDGVRRQWQWMQEQGLA